MSVFISIVFIKSLKEVMRVGVHVCFHGSIVFIKSLKEGGCTCLFS